MRTVNRPLLFVLRGRCQTKAHPGFSGIKYAISKANGVRRDAEVRVKESGVAS